MGTVQRLHFCISLDEINESHVRAQLLTLQWDAYSLQKSVPSAAMTSGITSLFRIVWVDLIVAMIQEVLRTAVDKANLKGPNAVCFI